MYDTLLHIVVMEVCMATEKKALSIYVTQDLFARIQLTAEEEGRSVSNYIERVIGMYVPGGEPRPGKVEVRGARDGGQVDLEDAIVDAVKRGPVRAAKHK